MLRKSNLLIYLTTVVLCVAGIALAKAIKVDLTPYGSVEPNASGHAVLNYAKGADKTMVQMNCWDLTSNTKYTVYLFYDDGSGVDWYTIGTFTTRKNGSGNLHVFLEGHTSGDVAVAVNNPSDETVLLGPDGATPPGGKTRCFLPDTPVWVNGALAPIFQVAEGWTVGQVHCRGTSRNSKSTRVAGNTVK